MFPEAPSSDTTSNILPVMVFRWATTLFQVTIPHSLVASGICDQIDPPTFGACFHANNDNKLMP